MIEQENIPPKYRNLALVHELDLAIWEKVFSVSLGDKNISEEDFTIELVKSFIESKDKVPGLLIEFLRVINLLGDSSG